MLPFWDTQPVIVVRQYSGFVQTEQERVVREGPETIFYSSAVGLVIPILAGRAGNFTPTRPEERIGYMVVIFFTGVKYNPDHNGIRP